MEDDQDEQNHKGGAKTDADANESQTEIKKDDIKSALEGAEDTVSEQDSSEQSDATQDDKENHKRGKWFHFTKDAIN